MKPGKDKREESSLADRVSHLADLVEYQNDAVVSRTLIKKNTGTVTIFAFDQFQALSEHTVPYDALIYLVDGEAEIIISGNAHRLAQGDMIIMPANSPHSVNAKERFKMVLILIRS